MSEQSFCRRKSKFGGMDVSEAKRLREMELEDGRLTKPLAEPDKAMLRDVVRKAVEPAGRSETTGWLSPVDVSRQRAQGLSPPTGESQGRSVRY